MYLVLIPAELLLHGFAHDAGVCQNIEEYCMNAQHAGAVVELARVYMHLCI